MSEPSTPSDLRDIESICEIAVRPPICGVYFLCSGDVVVYVGQSVHAMSRIASHGKSEKIFDRAFCVPCPPGKLDELERFYINRLLPPYNVDPRTKSLKRMPFPPGFAAGENEGKAPPLLLSPSPVESEVGTNV